MTRLPSAPGDVSARGLYVHIPFCIVRCAYCDFNAYAGMEDLGEPYVEALLREIDSAANEDPIATVFFGGGTPTQLPPTSLERILRAVRDSFPLDKSAEVSIEANPESVDRRVFEELLGAGFNRVSIGVQSTSPRVLSKLGRVHTPERALGALREAKAAGVKRLNADLIFGTPGESMDEFRRSLDQVLLCGVDHVSCYALTIEEGTPLASWVERGEFPSPDEDDQADKYEAAHAVLSEAGFERYEISNWAKDGSWCRHNVGYWTAGDYLGFGAGAHGHRSGRRSWNVRSPRGYIERSLGVSAHESMEDGFEILDREKRAEEALILGLRLSGGIDTAEFDRRFGVSVEQRWGSYLEHLVGEGLLELSIGSWRLTERGFLMAGFVARSLISDTEMVSTH